MKPLEKDLDKTIEELKDRIDNLERWVITIDNYHNLKDDSLSCQMDRVFDKLEKLENRVEKITGPKECNHKYSGVVYINKECNHDWYYCDCTFCSDELIRKCSICEKTQYQNDQKEWVDVK